MKTKVFMFALTINLLLAAQVPSDWVQVSGVVMAGSGQPLAYADISVFPMDVAVSGPLPAARTDGKGRYVLRTPAFPGRTRICAFKASAGYPNTQYLLYESRSEHMLELHLQAGVNLQNIDIHLGEPDGVVKFVVTDARTGSPITKARIVMRRMDDKPAASSDSVPSSGEYVVALPAVPIHISISAVGHETWTYRDDSGTALVLSPRENRTLKVSLTPTDKTP